MAKRKETCEDDGRVIARMNVEGMPWYRPGPKEERRGEEAGRQSGEPLSRRETLMILLHSMKWALLFSLAFCAILLAFILFCVFVWFR